MNSNSNNNIDSNNKNNLTFFRFFIICIIFIMLSFTINTYSNYIYNSNMNEFYSNFNKYDFDNAIKIINTTQSSNILKRKQLKSDLNSYFTNIVTIVVESIESDKISVSDAVSILSEIKKYNILNSSLDKLLSSLDSNYTYSTPLESTIKNNDIIDDNNNTDSIEISNSDTNDTTNNNLALGIQSMDDENYFDAISYFSKIPKSSLNDFNKAKDFIEVCKKNYKSNLLNEAEELIANKYYTDAIAFLSSYDTSILDSDDKDISDKINSVEMFRDEYNAHIESYANDDYTYTSTAILNSIDINNVNTLNIESNSSYFIYLSISDQTTYVYEGSLNNWKLIKSFSSSTGISGEETPKGIFSVSGRDTWFFSQKFEQGGKYWVRIMGDYLFHSLPFDETQTNIVDYTLGTPASHGCVRLNVEDSKWIYDNIIDGTKVIIN